MNPIFNSLSLWLVKTPIKDRFWRVSLLKKIIDYYVVSVVGYRLQVLSMYIVYPSICLPHDLLSVPVHPTHLQIVGNILHHLLVHLLGADIHDAFLKQFVWDKSFPSV